jgi:hypothetical protein
MKWIWVILLAIIGILAAIVAIEYFVVPIHSLPSYIPGYHHHRRGHYHKRGAVAVFIAVVALGAAGYLAFRFSRTQPSGPDVDPNAGPAPEGGSADQLLSDPPTSGGTAAG